MQKNWFKDLFSILPNLKTFTFKLLNKSNISLIYIDNKKIDTRKIVLSNNQLTLFWKSLTKAEQSKLLSKTSVAFNKYKIPVINDEAENLSKKVSKEIYNSSNQEDLKYFEGKIPQDDLYILRAAQYIKTVFDKGGDVENLKNSIRSTHGRRGANICNLYSAGYFNSWIKPMYESISKQDSFTLEKFHVAYNLVVDHYPFAVFVHRGMSLIEIRSEITRKLDEGRKYGIKILNIHGIGSDNIINITQVAKELREKKNYEIFIENGGGMFVLKIIISKKLN